MSTASNDLALSSAAAPLGESARQFSSAALVVGGVSLLAALGLGLVRGADALQYFIHSYLTNFAFFLAPTLGALFFVIIHHLSRAGWSVVVRRVSESLSLNITVMAALSLPILIYAFVSSTPLPAPGHSETSTVESKEGDAKPLVKPGGLYRWTDGAGYVAHERVVRGKRPYLNLPFFLIRVIGYFALWAGLAYFFSSCSLRQDATGDRNLSAVMERYSAPAVLTFSIALTFAAFDFFMTLNPKWYSTIFGVYYFAAGALSFFAVLIITLMILQRFGRLQGVVNVEHFHDLGKYLFGFTFFWTYIAFSQYMLIWYANIPEETEFLRDRQYVKDGEWGPWMNVGLALLVVHFFVPFLGLISRRAKRNRAVLAFWAIWMLAAHYLDMYWIVMPNYSKLAGELDRLPFRPIDVLCFVGFAGLLAANFVRVSMQSSLVPLRDPRLEESLKFKNF